MKLKCPCCGSVFSLDVLLASDGARDAVLAALEIPAPVGKLIIQYLALFRPAKRELTFDRVATLLQELVPMVRAGTIERNGRTWTAPVAYWKAALEEILIKPTSLQLPLKSHGYLLEIIVGMGNKAEADAEKKTEESRQNRDVGAPKKQEAPETSWEERQASAQKHIQELTKKLKTGATK